MGKLYKQFEEWVIRWELKFNKDEFLAARIRLVVIYTIISVIFLGISSYVLHWALISRLTVSAEDTILDPAIRDVILGRAETAVEDLIFLGDSIVFIMVIIIGFFLTKKTLEPIQTMIKKQERFIADASHELRTPLSVIKSGIEIALRKKELSATEARKSLEETLNEINILTVLSTDLLSVSKINAQITNFEKIPLAPLVEKTVKRLKPIAEQKNISLSFSGVTNVEKLTLGNSSALGRAFYQLIYNAIIYNKENGSVSVDYSVKGNMQTVNVKDNGIGISKENLKHIFEPFYRADNARTTSGSGLGLPMVKSVIDVHSGSILVKSKEGEGTTMTVELPVI